MTITEHQRRVALHAEIRRLRGITETHLLSLGSVRRRLIEEYGDREYQRVVGDLMAEQRDVLSSLKHLEQTTGKDAIVG